MKFLISIMFFLFSYGCMQNTTNAVKKSSTALKNSAGSATKLIGSSRSAIGSNSGISSPVVPAQTDNLIVFKGTGSGNVVCSYPSNFCKTDADESTGGARITGNIPNSANSFIHYMKFRFYSDGYFTNNPDGHIAFGLRGQVTRVEDVGANNAGADGRGMIFGHIGAGYSYNKNNPTCVDRMVEAETWFRTAYNTKQYNDASLIIPSTCSDTILEDYKWFTVELEVTTSQYIIIKIYNSDNQLIFQNYYNDQPNHLDPNLTGWFIGHVFETANKVWSVRLENFEVGQVIDTDIFYPIKDFTPALKYSTRFGDVNSSNANDFSIVLDKSVPSQIKINNLFNRTRVFGCISIRAGKVGADSVDCRNAANYREMNLKTESDWTYANNSLSLNESFLKSIPAGFYSSYTRENPQDETTQISLSFELRDSGSTAPAPSAQQFFCDGNNNMIYYVCGVPQPDSSWVSAGGGCFHKSSGSKCGTTPAVVAAPAPAPAPAATAAQFFCTGSHTKTYFVCSVPKPDSTWSDVGGGCFHKGTAESCN
jgi:hypothetical protein